MKTSYSALNTFNNCPQKYKFQEIDKIKTPKSKEAIFGTIVHESLKYMFSRDPLFPTLDEILSRFRESISASAIAEHEKERYRESGTIMLTKFWKNNLPWNFNIIDLESRFKITLKDSVSGEDHDLAGVIDRIDKTADDKYEVIDYKTSRRLPSQSAVDSDFQLSLYHLAVIKKWPHIKPIDISLSLFYVKAGEKLTTKRTSDQLKKTEVHIIEQINDIEKRTTTDDFPPKPTILCDWCGYKPLCPAWRHLYSKDNSPTPDKAEIDGIILEYLELKNKTDENKKRIVELGKKINEYLDSENLERLFTDEKMISRSNQERSSWNLDRVKQILEPLGLWDKILSPDEKKLSALLSSLKPETKKELQEHALTKKKFSALKISKRKTVFEEKA